MTSPLPLVNRCDGTRKRERCAPRALSSFQCVGSISPRVPRRRWGPHSPPASPPPLHRVSCKHKHKGETRGERDGRGGGWVKTDRSTILSFSSGSGSCLCSELQHLCLQRQVTHSEPNGGCFRIQILQDEEQKVAAVSAGCFPAEAPAEGRHEVTKMDSKYLFVSQVCISAAVYCEAICLQ